MLRHSFPTTALLAGLVALLVGCASEPTVRETGPPPDVRLGAVLDLLSFETGGDRVESVIDADGNAHVIIAARHPREVHHVFVSPDGIVQRERIAADSSPSTLGAAFGSDGRLHVLLDGRQLAREASTWSAAGPTPFSLETGLSPTEEPARSWGLVPSSVRTTSRPARSTAIACRWTGRTSSPRKSMNPAGGAP